MSTTPAPEVQDVSRETDDEGVHIVCCETDDGALCGKDVTEDNWSNDGDECETCARIEQDILRHSDGVNCPGCVWALIEVV